MLATPPLLLQQQVSTPPTSFASSRRESLDDPAPVLPCMQSPHSLIALEIAKDLGNSQQDNDSPMRAPCPVTPIQAPKQCVYMTEIELHCSETKYGDEVFVTGEWLFWDTSTAVKLCTLPEMFPIWKVKIQVAFITGTEYKYFIRSPSGAIRWEDSSPVNRFFNGQRILKDTFGVIPALGVMKLAGITTAQTENLNMNNDTTNGLLSCLNEGLIPLEVIGKSQFKVLKAYHPAFGLVAMKVIPLANPNALRQGATEAKLLELFSECRYAVRGLRADITDDRCLLLLEEYCINGSLFKVLYKDKMKFNLIQKLRILMHIAAALEFIHKKEYIHRDIKSPNILLDESFTAKLCDFGIAKEDKSGYTTISIEGTSVNSPRSSPERLVTKNPNVGSPIWMAPEIFSRRPHDRKADIYSFGVVIYEVMEEKLPHNRLHAEDIDTKANVMGPIIKACLSGEPSRRPSARYIKMEIRQMITNECKKILAEQNLPTDYRNIIQVYNECKNIPSNNVSSPSTPIGASVLR